MSEEFYQYCKAYPIYGSGQGSGSSPVLWIIISSILFDSHQQHSHGAQYSSPDHSTYINFSMIGFVDDSSSQVNVFDNHNKDNMEQLIPKMEKDLQLWSDMLTFTGGSLNKSKCSYHITSYSFCNSDQPILDYPSTEQSISIKEDGTTHEIKYLSHITEAKTLGVYKCLNSTLR